MDHGASAEFVNLDKFDGFNYTCWVDKMKFLLISLNLFYVLDPNLSPIPQDPAGEEADEKVIAELEKRRVLRKEDEALCYKYIINSLSDHLCDLCTLRSNNDPRLLWKTLEMNFKVEEPTTNKDLVRKYLEFRIVDGKSIMEQVHELQVLEKTLKANAVFLPEAFQIVSIIDKLPTSWKIFFKRILINRYDDISLDDLLEQIQIEERAREENNRDKQQSISFSVLAPPRSVNKTPAGDGSSTTKLGVKPDIKFKKNAPLKLHYDVGHRKPQHTKSGSSVLNLLDAELADLVAHVNLSM